MTVKKKIEENVDSLERKMLDIISHGGSVKEDGQIDKKRKNITVSIPITMLKEIEFFLNRRPGLTRNAWILEAIQDKFGGKHERSE